jgi:hypothetical protein
MKRLYNIATVGAMIAAILCSSPGYAADMTVQMRTDQGQDDALKSFDMAAESNQSLASIRGTAGNNFTAETLGVAVLEGISSGNTSQGGVTGANNISGNAFLEARGVSFVVQNSGNNAVVNAAMVVNLSLSQ